jgi:hypothetical protein
MPSEALGTRPPCHADLGMDQENPHFAGAETWEDAGELVVFEPRRPRRTEGHELRSLSVFVMDHKMRRLAVEDRSLEAHYGAFSVSQCRKGEEEARRWAVELKYGQAPRPVVVAGHEGRIYDLGPVPPPDDIDPRPPAVVVWHDGEMVYLVASGELESDALLRVAESLYR